MNIYEKIERIRKQPESARVRYVWGAVFVSMFLVILIWAFSWKKIAPPKIESNDSFKQISEDIQEMSREIDEIKKEAPSLKDELENIQQKSLSPDGAIDDAEIEN